MRMVLHLALSAFLAMLAGATTLQQLSVEEMTAKSTAIVRGKLSGSSTSALRGSVIYTVYTVQVTSWIKGSGSSTVNVYVPGGTHNGYRQSIAGSPALETSTDYVMFLWTSPRGVTQLIGLSQGLYQVKTSSTGETVLVRGPVTTEMVDGTGRMVADAGSRLSLSSLTATVRTQATHTEVR
jgi:hypothetical protein